MQAAEQENLQMDWYKVGRVFLIPFSIFCFIVILLTLCGSRWLCVYREESNVLDINTCTGLWVVCVTILDYGIGEEECTTSGGNVDDYVQVTRSFLVLSTLPCVLCIIFSFLFMFWAKFKPILLAISFVLTGVFVFIAMTVYTASVNKDSQLDSFTYNWSHIIGWFSIPLLVCGSLISFAYSGTKMPSVHIAFQD